MPHRHPLAQLLLIAAYIVIIRFAADVAAGGFPSSVAVRGFKQSVS
jgi:hypothetical protein